MKDDRSYLLHVRDAVERIRLYTTAGQGPFMADTRTQDAVIRNLDIVGEADDMLNDLPPEDGA